MGGLMSRKTEVPKINLVTVSYTGDTDMFERFLNCMADDYMNSDTKELIDVGLIIQSGNLYYLSGQSKSEVGDIWAFELKLSNWKRAIFQALQYKAFANYSVIVFPIEKEKLLLNNLETFRNLNIGVLLFDIKNQKSQWLVHPKKEKPISKSQTIYLLYKIASKH